MRADARLTFLAAAPVPLTCPTPPPSHAPGPTPQEFVAFAAAEGSRNNEPEAIKRVYPGGAFDPLGFAKDASKLDELKLKEVKNGRLAMVAFLGFVAQHAATGKGPVAALGEHLSSPWGANFGTNGVSLPF